MTPTDPDRAAAEFSAEQNAVLAGPVNSIIEIVEALSATPLTPEQHECVYRLRDAARILLQFVRQPEKAPPCPVPVPSPEEPRVCSILLLDCGRKLPEALRQHLTGLPHRVDHCFNRADALAMFRLHAYDLVLADPRCAPELPAVLRVIEQERGAGAHTPVIALQARDARQSPQEILRAGFDARITKPFDREAVVGVLSRFTASIASGPASPAVLVIQREFLARTIASVPPARQALARFDKRALRECGNFVSGAALPLGFNLLARAGSRLLQYANRNDWMKVRKCLDEIAAEAEMAAHAADMSN
jgi:CheY-like chemotaxis protein